ncbi:MAG: RidA family protein [Planctomycetaceae bacterium]|nr:RidA family protein [Planctomycetaceae bacterium]
MQNRRPTVNKLTSRRQFLGHCGLFTGGVAVGVLASSWLSSSTIPQATAEETPLHNAEAQLKKLGLKLPATSKPTATYVPTVAVGGILYVAGHGPRYPDGRSFVGKLGQDLDLEKGQLAARLAGLRILASVREALGSLDKVVRVVKTLGMVNATPDFTQHSQVINGCSDLMVEVFGKSAGTGARSAVGMSSLPGGIPVEIEMVFQIQP